MNEDYNQMDLAHDYGVSFHQKDYISLGNRPEDSPQYNPQTESPDWRPKEETRKRFL